MKDLEKVYEVMIAKLKKDHDAWVKSNFKMRSIESARSQIKTEGDISCNPALEILNEAYKKERLYNDDLTGKMYTRRTIVLEIEMYAKEHGKEWNGTFEIFGY